MRLSDISGKQSQIRGHHSAWYSVWYSAWYSVWYSPNLRVHKVSSSCSGDTFTTTAVCVADFPSKLVLRAGGEKWEEGEMRSGGERGGGAKNGEGG
jgi:hypothetical protein